MEIFKAGSRATRRAPAELFTGTVWQDPIIEAPDPARITALRVSFEPGARTAWHTHPYGQTLHVLHGAGLVCLRGEAPRVMLAGDTVWIPPDVEHWHGAAPDNSMVHLALQELKDGSPADWLEHVSDEDYSIPPEVSDR